MKQETAEKAAQWWADQLGEGGTDMGANDPSSLLAQSMGSMLQRVARSKNTQQSLESFKKNLEKRLLSQTSNWVYIGCDYGPDGILADAAHESGVNSGAFPWKTNMNIHDDVIQVAEGYGAPYVQLD